MTTSTNVFGVSLGFVLAAAAACGTDANEPCTGAASGTACRWAGTGARGFNKETPTADKLQSQLDLPTDLTFGPDGRAYIVDFNNHMLRRVEKDNSLTIVMGTDYEGDGDPEMQDRLPVCNPPGALGTTVALNHPTEARFGPDGLLYVSAWHNNKILMLDTATDIVTALAGNSYGFTGDGGPACAALFNQPKSLVFAPDGTLYTVDQRNGRIRKISAGATLGQQMVSTIAGTGALGNLGDGGPAINAQFGFELVATPRPSGSLVLVDNLLYVADSLNHRVRRINLDTGIIDCIAGASAQPGYSGDGGPALQAQFNFPNDLELGPDGRLYVSDRYNHAIRAIDLSSGIVETVVGNGSSCDNTMTTCPDRGPALSMELNEPSGLAFDGDGNMYIADTNNSRILKVVR